MPTGAYWAGFHVKAETPKSGGFEPKCGPAAASRSRATELSQRSWVNGTVSGTDDYSYDDAGRLIEAEQNNRTLTIDYDSAQRVSQLTYPGGMEVDYVYDLDGRVTQIKRDGNAIAIYTYDAAGRRATRSLANGLTTSYTYDAAGQPSPQGGMTNEQ